MEKSTTLKEQVGCGKIYVHIGHSNKKVKRVEFHLGKQGSCPRVLCGALTECLNIMFGMGVNIDDIIKALEGHGCGRKTKRKDGQTLSCSDGIAQALREFKVELMTMPPETKPNPKL